MGIGGVIRIGVALVLVGGVALAQPAGPGDERLPRAPFEIHGYLTLSTAPDAVRILPPAPRAGSARYERDRRIFLATRSNQMPGRWELAIADADSGVDAVLHNFRCSLGADLTPANAPRVSELLAKVRADIGIFNFRNKLHFHRQRPFLIDAGRICVAHTITLDTEPDYPSGHAAWGWAAAMILAELAPDRATPLLVRGRAYGDSRVVCGVHNASAIEAGRTWGGALVAAEHGSGAFRTDLEAARSEVLRIRSAAGDLATAPACQAEAALIAPTPYPF